MHTLQALASARQLDPVDLQRQYYRSTASAYDDSHLTRGESHDLAIGILTALLKEHGLRSVLDVGAGTGRALAALCKDLPDVEAVGVEPVAELREEAIKKGVPPSSIRAGDATALEFPDSSFDIVCAFGVLHHVPQPAAAITEMLRVARCGIFLSDSNRFAQGSWIVRRMKWLLFRFGLWPAFQFLQTRGRMYHISEGDGVFYSYSLYDNLNKVRQKCDTVLILPMCGSGRHPLFDASHLVVFAAKPVNPRSVNKGH